jgi:DNA-binding MarR family transcriptional regulator
MNDPSLQWFFCDIVAPMAEHSGTDSPSGTAGGRGTTSAAWLLAQVGAHAAAMFAARLSALGLAPTHAGILRVLAQTEGLSQRRLARQLEILPSRLVSLVDELEARGLVQRRDSDEDRRVYALYLTDQGRATLDAIGRVAREHDAAVCAALSGDERRLLVDLLRRIADQQGLKPGVHPGFRRLGRSGGGASGGEGGEPDG